MYSSKSFRFSRIMVAGLIGLAPVSSAAIAGSAGNDGNSFNQHVRYPKDRAIKEGNFQMINGKMVPYVEKCRWIFGKKPNGTGFGLTQVCRRYTLDNTEIN